MLQVIITGSLSLLNRIKASIVINAIDTDGICKLSFTQYYHGTNNSANSRSSNSINKCFSGRILTIFFKIGRRNNRK
jgi:hypothetical protein